MPTDISFSNSHILFRPGSTRVFDVTLALALAIPVGLICIAIALVLLLAQGRPILYPSERMADLRMGFTLWKFRTMLPSERAAEIAGGHLSARITPIGRILRRTRLDELPQLWNVLRGDMAFVGPRPPLRSVVARYPAIYATVLSRRPGVTGLATVRYCGREARSLARCATGNEAEAAYARCVRHKARLDRLHACRQSVALDVAVIIATLTGWFPRARARRAVASAARSGGPRAVRRAGHEAIAG